MSMADSGPSGDAELSTSEKFEAAFEELDALDVDTDEDASGESPAAVGDVSADADAPVAHSDEADPPENVEPEDVAEGEAEAEEEPAVEAEAETEPATAAEAETPEAPPDETPSEAPKHEPFSFTADGGRVDVPGAVRVSHDDGAGNVTQSVVVPVDVWQRSIQPYLGNWGAREQRYKDELAKLDPEKNPEVIRAKALIEKFDGLLDDPEAFAAFFDNFEANRDKLRLELENRALKARTEGYASSETQRETQERYEVVAAQIRGDLPARVDMVARQLGVDLPADVRDRLVEDMYADVDRLYFVAQEGNEWGIKAGEIAAADVAFAQRIQRAAQLIAYGANSVDQQRQDKKEAARQRNEKALNRKKVPATVPAAGSAPSSGPEEPKIESWEDFEDWSDSDDDI
jgi:hypothetical protein